ncbi:UNVERIFIED_CONTAM: hypothetical protein NCL1_38593 [Trichonephila clavipes]
MVSRDDLVLIDVKQARIDSTVLQWHSNSIRCSTLSLPEFQSLGNMPSLGFRQLVNSRKVAFQHRDKEKQQPQRNPDLRTFTFFGF